MPGLGLGFVGLGLEPRLQTTGHGKLQLVGLGMKQNDARVNGLAAIMAQAVLGDDAWVDLNLHPKAEHAREDRATSTPPLSSLTSAPGLFTSKERTMISHGSEVKL